MGLYVLAMGRVVRILLLAVLIATVLLIPSPAVSTSLRPASYAIIVNKANPVEELSTEDLRRIFLGERTRWPGGRVITVAIPSAAAGSANKALRLISGKDESEFRRHWLQAAFQGEAARAPRELDSSLGVRKFVFNAPGAIGYVPAEEADESVKTLRIGSKAPGDEGYSLRETAK